jgi:hypothetical protein
MLVGGMRSVGSDEDGVAVGRRFLDELGADEARSTWLVFDYNRLLRDAGEFDAECPRELVRGAARCEGDDEGDRLVRVLSQSLGDEVIEQVLRVLVPGETDLQRTRLCATPLASTTDLQKVCCRLSKISKRVPRLVVMLRL